MWVINPAVDCQYFPPGLQLPPQPLRRLLPILLLCKQNKWWGAGMVWSEVQTCIWPSWCHCHSLSLASVKSRLVLPFWYRLTWVVPEKGPLNGCVCFIMLLCCYLQCFDTVGWVTGRPSGLSKPILLAPTGSSQYRENENRELTIQDRFAWKMTSGCRLLPFTVLFNSRDCVAVLYDNSVSSLNCNWNQADPNQQEHNQVIWELERLYEFPLYHPSLVYCSF